MSDLSEQFGTKLIRVIKNVKRRTSGGGTRTVRQAYHVKKANPGDQYSALKTRNMGSLGEKPSLPKAPPAQQDLPVDGEMTPDEEGEAVTQEPSNRLEVRYHDIAWAVDRSVLPMKKQDPVPDAVRNRYSSKNRASRAANPNFGHVPLNTVSPTDPVLWGAHEPDTLDKLRTASISRMKLIGRDNGLMMARLEHRNATSLNAYVALDSLTDPHLFLLWGDFYGLEKGNGSVAKRSAASYEVAKAVGFDDLVPPTVARFDEYGDIGPVLPDDLLERFNYVVESLARKTGEHPETIRNQLGGYAALQLAHEDTWTIEHEQWFLDIFSTDEESKTDLANLYEAMPEGRRMGFVRAAAFDFISWIGDRHFGDVIFCNDDRHPIHLMGNELSLPCPRMMGLRNLEAGGDSFVSSEVDPKAGVPMLWSEPSILLATRGGEAELDAFEKIGIYVARRMKGDRAFEMARSLVEHEVPPLNVAGVLSRAWLMGTHAKEIARDPYMVVRYYADLIAARDVTQFEGVELFVNDVMHRVLVKDFNFATSIREEHEGDGSTGAE